MASTLGANMEGMSQQAAYGHWLFWMYENGEEREDINFKAFSCLVHIVVS